MVLSKFNASYDGVCIYATIEVKASVIAKILLLLINLTVLFIIGLFTVMGIVIAAIFFLTVEFFILKFTLWNLYGTEKLIMNTKSFSYQYGYGFFITSFKTIKFNKAVQIHAANKGMEGTKQYMKILLTSFNEDHLPVNIHLTTLWVSENDFQKFIELNNQLYLDQMSEDYLLPTIHVN